MRWGAHSLFRPSQQNPVSKQPVVIHLLRAVVLARPRSPAEGPRRGGVTKGDLAIACTET